MTDCISAQEISENSAAEKNVDEEIEAERNISVILPAPEECREPDTIPSSEHIDQTQNVVDDDRGSLVITEEAGEAPASPPVDDEVHSSSQVADANNPNSSESGEVSSEDSTSSINLEFVDEDEDSDDTEAFLDYYRSQTPLQDEQDSELSTAANAFEKDSAEKKPTATDDDGEFDNEEATADHKSNEECTKTDCKGGQIGVKRSGPEDKTIRDTKKTKLSVQIPVEESMGSKSEIDWTKYQEYLFSSRIEGLTSVTPSHPFIANEPQLDTLSKMKQILFLDMDNYSKAFPGILTNLPERTFLWAFYGGKKIWEEPIRDIAYAQAKAEGRVYISDKCGPEKNSADFAMCSVVGRLDAQLQDDSMKFIVLSGDYGFKELARQFNRRPRQLHVVDPHHAPIQEIYQLLQLLAEYE